MHPQAASPTLNFMSDLESQLLAALTELEVAARTMPTAGPKPPLRPLFARIDELAAQLPPDTDPELRHFLQRHSYEKARQRLHGTQTQRGACGG